MVKDTLLSCFTQEKENSIKYSIHCSFGDLETEISMKIYFIFMVMAEIPYETHYIVIDLSYRLSLDTQFYLGEFMIRGAFE